MPQLIQPFGPEWNYCDNEDRGPLSKAKILHYTAMDTQPHLKYAVPRLAAVGQKHWFNGQVRKHPRQEIQDLFDEYLAEAIKAGYAPENYVPNAAPVIYKKADLANYRGHR
jgi:hypothetical protein